jgi:hypothetical protein
LTCRRYAADGRKQLLKPKCTQSSFYQFSLTAPEARHGNRITYPSLKPSSRGATCADTHTKMLDRPVPTSLGDAPWTQVFRIHLLPRKCGTPNQRTFCRAVQDNKMLPSFPCLDYVKDPFFRTYLPQIAHVRSSDFILKTDIRIQFSIGLR